MTGPAGNLGAAKADACNANADGEQTCPLVAPTIVIEAPKTIVVPRDYVAAKKPYKLKPHRIAVRLGVDRAFDGEGVLSTTSEGDRVRFFTRAKGGKEKTLPLTLKAKNFNSGHTLYIQAKTPSSGVDKTILKWELKGGSKPKKSPVTDKLTCIKLTLDLFKTRDPAAPATDPVKLAENSKHDPGRYVHVQAADPLPLGPGDAAHVPADRLPYERAQIIVRPVEPNDWAGTLVLLPCTITGKANTSSMEIFTHEQPAKSQATTAAPHEIAHSAGFTDVKLWLQGKNVSKKMLDAPVKLGIKGTTDNSGTVAEGDRAVLTVLKTELALCESRKKRRRNSKDFPQAMSFDDRHKKGRFVHVQFANHHGRGGVLIKPVKPKSFRGTLQLGVWDPAANAKSTANIELFDDEVPAAGQAAKANTFDVTVDAAFQKKGKCFWAQGKAVSGALRNTQVRLLLQEHINLCDSGKLTAVQFSDIKAVIPSTPANVPRAGVNTPVLEHEFDVAMGGAANKDFDENFAINAPLVLLENSLPVAKLVHMSVKVQPAGVPVAWSVQRDTRPAPNGDHPNTRKLPGSRKMGPSLTAVATKPLEQQLALDSCGSFHVRPFVDCNGSGKFEHNAKNGKRIDRQPFVIMNLILVRAQMKRDRSRHRSANANVNVAGGNIRVSTGNFVNGAGAGVHCKAKVRVTGGGRDGKLGLDKVFGGWVNNELLHPGSPAVPQSEDAVAVYQNPGPPPVNHTRFSFWTLPPNGGFTMYGPPPPPLPATAAGPTLDCTNFGAEGTGGNRCVGTEGAVGPPLAIVKSDQNPGQYWTIEMWDSPGDSTPTTHPQFAGSPMQSYRFNLNFRVDLCFWTSQSGAPAPTAAKIPACRLYASVATHTWNIRFSSAFNAAAGTLANTNITLSITKDANNKKCAIPVEASGLEVRGPCTLNMLAVDEST